MSTTQASFVLEADTDVAQFLNSQPTTTDPSALVNRLLRAAKDGDQSGKATSGHSPDGVNEALEDFVDQTLPAGG